LAILGGFAFSFTGGEIRVIWEGKNGDSWFAEDMAAVYIKYGYRRRQICGEYCEENCGGVCGENCGGYHNHSINL